MSSLKSFRLNSILTSFLVIALGILLIAWPGETIIMFIKVMGAFVVVVGILQLIRGITADNRSPIEISVAVCILIFGAWIFLFPDPISKFVPVVLGVLLAVHGADTIATAVTGKKAEIGDWVALMVLGIISIAGGIFAILCSGWIRNGFMIVLGIILIYDGVTSLLVQGKVAKAEKDIIDIDSQDIDDTDDFV